MEEEHLHQLCIVFECFREDNLKLKPTKCEFFRSEINYLDHHISKEGVWPSKENLKAVAEFTPPQTFTKIWAFLGLVGQYWGFIKGFVHIVQPLPKHVSGEGTSKKNKHVTLIRDALEAFKMLMKAFLKAHVLAFADFIKPFLLETNVSKLGLGAVLPQKQTDDHYHPVAYMSQSVNVHKCSYQLTKQVFLALKWLIAE